MNQRTDLWDDHARWFKVSGNWRRSFDLYVTSQVDKINKQHFLKKVFPLVEGWTHQHWPTNQPTWLLAFLRHDFSEMLVHNLLALSYVGGPEARKCGTPQGDGRKRDAATPLNVWRRTTPRAHFWEKLRGLRLQTPTYRYHSGFTVSDGGMFPCSREVYREISPKLSFEEQSWRRFGHLKLPNQNEERGLRESIISRVLITISWNMYPP